MNSSKPVLQSHYPQLYLINPDRVGASVLQGMLANAGIQSRTFDSPSQLLQALPLAAPACIMFDFVMPEMSGLRLLQLLRHQQCLHPCILSASRAEPEHLAQAMQRGAFGFIKRPLQALELIELVQAALSRHRAIQPHIENALDYQRQRDRLSPRERQVLMHLELGKSARETAAELKLSPRTVENHRLRLLRKLDLNTSTELIQRITTLNVLRATGLME
ncbi:MAG: response regulator [Gammaproteobacteria bacterium SHHR-1]|uniref:response regulator transcription factor n=1 Tax=Magnetovirga frankeli TaxID=947516 RepID=UPI001293AFFC|nr:response regulator [gamma proteobacterium SS-5]